MSVTRQGRVVSRQTLTADARVQLQVSPRGIYATQNGTGAGVRVRDFNNAVLWEITNVPE
jgi:hypothetical protein